MSTHTSDQPEDSLSESVVLLPLPQPTATYPPPPPAQPQSQSPTHTPTSPQADLTFALSLLLLLASQLGVVTARYPELRRRERLAYAGVWRERVGRVRWGLRRGREGVGETISLVGRVVPVYPSVEGEQGQGYFALVIGWFLALPLLTQATRQSLTPSADRGMRSETAVSPTSLRAQVWEYLFFLRTLSLRSALFPPGARTESLEGRWAPVVFSADGEGGRERELRGAIGSVMPGLEGVGTGEELD
ncbi:hypothetical protein DACRYDRAFT_111988 [Dacryopinax primogenitus]|uniref:Uncharacterized protein n=1 Tax=Dacryopinax primogenitus (strain DJM 731) TaxID=1858805 RepID=M5FQ05_DACPD|nr:uncharacterized protein DACRYDRAFT_111988 [Dacryopinax primogenitus]EJT97453.1 hypothetical protein DACRYDRAFT_111988 [Dacryopinax primogenitus]